MWEYRYIIALVIGFIFYAIFEWQRTQKILYALIAQAKRYAKDMILKSGKEQEDWVVEKAYICLPLMIRGFISEDMLRKIIRYLYDKLKDFIDDGEFNGSVRIKY